MIAVKFKQIVKRALKVPDATHAIKQSNAEIDKSIKSLDKTIDKTTELLSEVVAFKIVQATGKVR